MKSRAIAYVAVLSALALAIVMIVHYLIPAKIVPLALVSAIGLIAFYLLSWKGGIAFIVVVEILSFVLTGLSVTFFTLSVLFIPYIIYAYAIRKLSYLDKKGRPILRGIISLVVFFLLSLALAFTTLAVTGENSVLIVLQEKIGIYLACLLLALVAIPADFFISQVAIVAVNRINKSIKK